MTKQEWLQLEIPSIPLIAGKKYRLSRVVWSNGNEVFPYVVYKF